MRTHMHHLTAATVAALTGLSSPSPLPATDYEASDYLPLAVGNSWTFRHEVFDRYGGIFLDLFAAWPAYEEALPDGFPVVTITVERTEAIGDTTYYVLSDMPTGGWPPQPPHCLAGKKLRWKGGELMERTDTGEQSFFRFEGGSRYTIPLTHGDDEVRRRAGGGPPPRPPTMGFALTGNSALDWLSEFETEGWRGGRAVVFLAGYGLERCTERAEGYNDQGTVFKNRFHALRAVLVEGGSDGGASGQSGTARTIHIDDAVRGGPPPGSPASSSSSSWGQVKTEIR